MKRIIYNGKHMMKAKTIKWAVALSLLVSAAFAAEINDLDITDASNTGRFPENMAPSAVNDGARALEGLIARWHENTNGSIVSGGSANAYTVAAKGTQTLFDGLVIAFDATFANTSTASLNVDATGAKEILKHNDVSLASGDIEVGQKVVVVYDGTNWQMISPTATDMSDPMTTRGDMIVRNSSNVTARLAAGGANAVLKSDGSDLLFSKVTLAMIADGPDGSLLTWGSSASAAFVTPGISGHVLTSSGPGAAPRYQAISTGLPTADFTSAEQSVTVDNALNVAHSLGVTPALVQVVLRNKTADLNYAVGEEVVMPPGRPGAVSDSGITISQNSTYVIITTGEQIAVHDKSSKNGGAIAVAKWKWVVKAWQ